MRLTRQDENNHGEAEVMVVLMEHCMRWCDKIEEQCEESAVVVDGEAEVEEAKDKEEDDMGGGGGDHEGRGRAH